MFEISKYLDEIVIKYQGRPELGLNILLQICLQQGLWSVVIFEIGLGSSIATNIVICIAIDGNFFG